MQALRANDLASPGMDFPAFAGSGVDRAAGPAPCGGTIRGIARSAIGGQGVIWSEVASTIKPHDSILRPTQSKRPGCHAMVDASIARPPECKCLPSGRLRASCHNWRMGAHRIVVFKKYGAVFLARRRVRDTPTHPAQSASSNRSTSSC